MLKRYNGKMGGTDLTFGEFQQRYAQNKKESNGNDKNYSITNIGTIQQTNSLNTAEERISKI